MTTGLALYPGSFDPFTLGHLDIVERASRLFSRLEVTVARNAGKTALLTADERCELIRASITHLDNVTVRSFNGLLADHAVEQGAVALVRGLRQVSDFEYELRMAFANRRLAPGIETIFLMTNEEYALISSSIVRDIHHWKGDISSFVPEPVRRALTNS